MTADSSVVFKIMPVVLLIAFGAALKKRNFLSKEAVAGMKKLVLNFSLPCLIFLTFLRSDIKPEYFVISTVVFASCSAALSLGFLFKRLQRSANQFYPSVFSSFTTGLVGYPLFTAVFGAEQLYKLAILDIGNLVFIFTVLTNFLQKVSCEFSGIKKLSLKEQLIGMLKSPLLVGAALGIAASLSGHSQQLQSNPLSSALIAAVSLISSLSVPLTLIIIGQDLNFSLRNFLKPASAVLLRMAVMLSAAWLLNTYVVEGMLGLDRMFQVALYTLFILPPTFLIPVYIEGDCEEKGFVVNFFSIHIVFTLAAFVILTVIIG